MRLFLALALLLCSSTALRADMGPAAPDDSLFRTEGNERFEVALKGVTGAHIDVRAEVSAGRHCSIRTATSQGMTVLVDILIHEGEQEKQLLKVRLVECPTNRPVRVVGFSDLFAPGESKITGAGWDELFEISLAQK